MTKPTVSRLAALWSDLRQLRYPASFRISPHALSPIHRQRSAEADEPVLSEPRAQQRSGEAMPPAVTELLPLCLHLWRAQQRMVAPGTNDPLPEYRRPYRHIHAALEALNEAGFTIQDHTGEPYHEGEALHVVAAERSMESSRPMVLETLKPTIYYRSNPIQLGEVILSLPAEPTTSGNGGTREGVE